jgi:hypothetical protein
MQHLHVCRAAAALGRGRRRNRRRCADPFRTVGVRASGGDDGKARVHGVAPALLTAERPAMTIMAPQSDRRTCASNLPIFAPYIQAHQKATDEIPSQEIFLENLDLI